jgi:hypothetical protein
MKYKIEATFETDTLISLEKMKEFIPFWLGEIERNWIPIQNLVTSVQEVEIKQEKAQELDIVAHAVDSI